MKCRRQILRRFLSLGSWLCLVAWGWVPAYAGSESLDDVVSCMETNGLLVDRAGVIAAGLRGMLKSIDPEADIRDARDVVRLGLDSDKAGSVVQDVELWPENLAYLKLSGLDQGSGEEVLTHLKALSARRGLLLDLRGAGGEDMESACLMASLVRDEHTPLFLVTDNYGKGLITNKVVGSFSKVPLLMVLIDEGTDGASEALVSVLKGGSGVILIGSTTKGDRKLRRWVPLPNGQIARLSTSKWEPLPRDKHGKAGVKPDIVVEGGDVVGKGLQLNVNHHERIISTKSDADQELMLRVEGDATLQRATDLLLGLQALGGYGQD